MLAVILLSSGFQPGPKTIVLHGEHLSVTPKEFYIADVVDERENRNEIAWLLPVAGKDNTQLKPYPADLEGGGLKAIKQFIERSLPKNKALRPVTIRLKKFVVIETYLTGGRVEGHISLTMSFDLQRGNDDPMHLADYSGSANYNRKAGPPQEIEPTLRRVLEDGLLYLNTWMDKQADTNIKLAKEVKVTFTDYKEKKEDDTIYYSAKRPLTWDDFKADVPSSKYDAESFPGFGYYEHAEVVKGILKVELAIKVYLPKSASWVKDYARTPYALNHEQRHFDIVKIVAEHFKKKISTEPLPVSNFEGPINVEYLESFREMNRLQKQYDNETRHGSDQTAQQRWNDKIDAELGVKR